MLYFKLFNFNDDACQPSFCCQVAGFLKDHLNNPSPDLTILSPIVFTDSEVAPLSGKFSVHCKIFLLLGGLNSWNILFTSKLLNNFLVFLVPLTFHTYIVYTGLSKFWMCLRLPVFFSPSFPSMPPSHKSLSPLSFSLSLSLPDKKFLPLCFYNSMSENKMSGGIASSVAGAVSLIRNSVNTDYGTKAAAS